MRSVTAAVTERDRLVAADAYRRRGVEVRAVVDRITRRVLVADPAGRPDVLAARGAMLAAGRASVYAELEPDARDAIVLARALGWKSDRIALQLGITAAETRARITRGLRTLIPCEVRAARSLQVQ